MPEPEKIVMLPISKVRLAGGTQSRAGLDSAVVAEYAERIAAGDEFPPVVVFYDGAVYWPGSGHHRCAAHELAGRKHVKAVVRDGGRRDAILYSVSSNIKHGHRADSHADKRCRVQLLLDDPEWRQWNNHEIARRCGVSEGLVRAMKADMASGNCVLNADDPAGPNADSDFDPEDDPRLWSQVERLVAKLRRKCALLEVEPEAALAKFPARA